MDTEISYIKTLDSVG